MLNYFNNSGNVAEIVELMDIPFLRSSMYNNRMIKTIKLERLNTWWKNLPVAKKLYSVVGVMAILIMTELFTLMFAMDILSAARAFVGGEGLWSKAQKNATLEMQNYIITRDPKYYKNFLDNMRIPLGDRRARVELEKAEMNYAEAEIGFLEGRNDQRDIASMINLMRRFSSISYLQRTIEAWRNADLMADELLHLGEQIHTVISRTPKNWALPEQAQLLAKLSAVNEALTVHEDEFSFALGEASRWVEHTLMLMLLIAVLAVESTGLYLTFRFSRALTSALAELNHTANLVGAGDFTKVMPIRSNDELGQLAQALNKMSSNLYEITSERQQAEEANQVKSLFLANMSHEIRTPLAAMLGFVELLKDSDTSEAEKKKFLEVISRTGDTLVSIINDILDISKVEAGKIEIKNEPFSLTGMLKDLRLLLELRCAEKGIFLSFHKIGEIPPKLNADPMRIRQILLNIIGNAIKFTSRGGIDIVYKVEHGKLIFSVIDTGDGIAPENEKKLFKDFSQGDLSIRKARGGTGLGLSLSRKLARLMKGEVYLEKSSVGKGSTFVIRIPVDFEKHETDSKMIPFLESTGVKSQRLKNLKILVVEDSPENQTLMLLFLGKAGAHVEVAVNGLEATRMAAAKTYDLILMDMQMPIMDGYTATRELRKKGMNLPIIALTAHAMKEDLDKCIVAGCDDVISKPVQRNELISRLEAFHDLHKISVNKSAA